MFLKFFPQFQYLVTFGHGALGTIMGPLEVSLHDVSMCEGHGAEGAGEALGSMTFGVVGQAGSGDVTFTTYKTDIRELSCNCKVISIHSFTLFGWVGVV